MHLKVPLLTRDRSHLAHKAQMPAWLTPKPMYHLLMVSSQRHLISRSSRRQLQSQLQRRKPLRKQTPPQPRVPTGMATRPLKEALTMQMNLHNDSTKRFMLICEKADFFHLLLAQHTD